MKPPAAPSLLAQPLHPPPSPLPVTFSSKPALTEVSKGRRTGSLPQDPGWPGVSSVRPGRAGGGGGGSGSGTRGRPGAHWLVVVGPGSARPHKGGRPPPAQSRCPAMSPPPALPWLLAACCLCALPRGSGTSRRRRSLSSARGETQPPAPNLGKGRLPSRGEAAGLGSAAFPHSRVPSPQGSLSLSRATGTAWICPKARYVRLRLPRREARRGTGAVQPGLVRGGGNRDWSVAGK